MENRHCYAGVAGNMAEWCESSGDKCFYVPSRRWTTPDEGQWECRAQFANSRLAEPDASEWSLAQSHINSDSNLGNMPHHRLNCVHPDVSYSRYIECERCFS